MNWRNFFRGKKVTLMGLGLLGRGVGDAEFLARMGAEVLVTDLKTERELALSVARLKKFKNIKFHLGGHRLEYFSGKGGRARPDFVLKAAGVPLDSPYIKEARENGIPIEMDASLFAKLAPKGTKLVGITGTRGKSTTAECIYAILKTAKKRAFLGGVVHTATLPFLERVRAGDIVVLELDSWQLQGFHEAKISPHVAVFTTFLDDHLVYYQGNRKRYFEDKAAIFRYQKSDTVLIVGEQAMEAARHLGVRLPSGARIVGAKDLLTEWKLKILGEHNRYNAACALAVARALEIPDEISRKAIENFKGVSGRLEYLRTIQGVKIYNDNNATTPDATIAALRALNPKSQTPCLPIGGQANHKQIQNHKALNARRFALNAGTKRIILIMGGTDKGLDMSKLVEEIPKHCKAVILLRETGTEKLIFNFQFSIFKKETLKECVEEAMKIAKKGDIVLFSPAFASFGKWFKNEYDRGEQFVKIIDKIS